MVGFTLELVANVTTNGVRLYYEERGSGTPILGLHGAGSSAVFWEDAADRLSELGRVIIYDRRGAWRSDRPEPYEITSVQEHADDARELLRELDAEPAILIGAATAVRSGSTSRSVIRTRSSRWPSSKPARWVSLPNTTSGSRRLAQRSSRLLPNAASTW